MSTPRCGTPWEKHKPHYLPHPKAELLLVKCYGHEKRQRSHRPQDGLCTLLLQWGLIILFAFLWILICIIRWLLEKLISWILFVQSEISQQLTQTSVSCYQDWFPRLAFLGIFCEVQCRPTEWGYPPTPSTREERLVGQLVKVLPRLLKLPPPQSMK